MEKTNLSELKEMVKSLADIEETDECVRRERVEQQLQKIGKELITNYVIILPGDIVIQPLWVEAYYSDIDSMEAYESNIGKKFMDPFIHGADEQKGAENFGKLYFHHKADDLRSGVDICLSCGQYYLSFLLKYSLVSDSLVGNMFITQSQLSGKIRTAYNKLSENEQSGILNKIDNRTEYEYVACTTRIGLDPTKEKDSDKKEQKELYKPLRLAIVRDFHKTFFGTKSLPTKETLVKQYLNDPNNTMTMAEKVNFCKAYLGYCPTDYKEK